MKISPAAVLHLGDIDAAIGPRAADFLLFTHNNVLACPAQRRRGKSQRRGERQTNAAWHYCRRYLRGAQKACWRRSSVRMMVAGSSAAHVLSGCMKW